MNIREDSKRIIADMLEHAVECGDMDSGFFIDHEHLTSKLNLPSENYCRVCCQYLNGMGYIRFIRGDVKSWLVELNASGVNFLECL